MSLPEEQVYDPLEIAYHEINQLNRENAQLRKEREGLIKGIINIRNLCRFQSSAICLAVGERAEALLAKLEGWK
jgi:hypothetical protein